MNLPDSTPLTAEDRTRLLVADLNHLRAINGMVSYRKLAIRTNYSRSALWRATRGSRLPSREITLALASACGGDTAEWDHKWRTASGHMATARIPGREAGPTAASPASPLPGHASPARRLTRTRLVVLAATIVALGTTTAVVATSLPHTGPSVAASQPDTHLAKPADGDDPYLNKCGTDQQRLEYQNVYWPDHALYGWLELYHSHVCNASWAYVFGPNSARWQITIAARRLPDHTVAPSSTNANDPPNSWGNVLSTPSGTCVRVEAFITVGTIRGPIAVTSCQPDRQGGGISPPPTPAPTPPPQYTTTPGEHGSSNHR